MLLGIIHIFSYGRLKNWNRVLLLTRNGSNVSLRPRKSISLQFSSHFLNVLLNSH